MGPESVGAAEKVTCFGRRIKRDETMKYVRIILLDRAFFTYGPVPWNIMVEYLKAISKINEF